MAKESRKPIVVAGWDVSLNHSAMIQLTDGELSDFKFITDRAGDSQTSKRAVRLQVPKDIRDAKDKHRINMWRLNFITDQFWKWLSNTPDYVGIEDYALRAEQGAHQMGEAGGAARLTCYKAGIPFRLHDPTSVKMFIAHDGSCGKDEVKHAVSERWDMEFEQFDTGKSEQTSEDLADAYGIAQMVWLEYQLRHGLIALSDFHPKEIRVFHRVTKYQPVCLLERGWIES